MRRFHVGLAILAFALLAPIGAQADDRQIAKEIVAREGGFVNDPDFPAASPIMA